MPQKRLGQDEGNKRSGHEDGRRQKDALGRADTEPSVTVGVGQEKQGKWPELEAKLEKRVRRAVFLRLHQPTSGMPGNIRQA
jgi:hypothetical protein